MSHSSHSVNPINSVRPHKKPITLPTLLR